MQHPAWASLPAELQARADELLVADRKLQAVKLIRDSLPERNLGIYECLEMLFERCNELGELWVRSSAPLDLDALTEKVASLPQPPDVIEALWDCDSFSHIVDLVAVTLQPLTEHRLAMIRRGSDARSATGQVIRWSEAEEATAIGSALAERFGVSFYFASPDRPGFDLPRWADGQRH